MSRVVLLPIGSLIVAITAGIISLYAVFRANKAHNEKLAADTVILLYSHFQTFSDVRVANWEVSHLFELASGYEQVCSNLLAAVQPLGEPRRHELLLKERAIALRIFDLFEQTLYQKVTADTYRDPYRSRFLQEVLDYFTGRWLRNPRLRYLWDDGLHEKFEPATVEYYNNHINGGDNSETIASSDPMGPYGSFTQFDTEAKS